MQRASFGCACGHVELGLTGPPIFRMLCHCTICQRYQGAPYGDVLVCSTNVVEGPNDGTVEFGAYRPPPNVQRGKCVKCGGAALEVFDVPLLPKLTMLPARALRAEFSLPDPVAHFFYETRIADIDDALPKHQGYFRSHMAFLGYYLRLR